MAAGLAQFIANRYAAGVRDDGDLDKVEDGLLYAITEIARAMLPEIPKFEKYDLCEFYCHRHPRLKPGFQPAQGGLLENAAENYPEAWEYLQSSEGSLLCKTEAAWQALTTATWATLADGSTVGWNGIGGAPFYALHLDTGALRLPDLRGMHVEAAGFNALDVGGAAGDVARRVMGWLWPTGTGAYAGGVCYPRPGVYGAGYGSHASNEGTGIDTARVVPTGPANAPRRWGALACVYLGRPAS